MRISQKQRVYQNKINKMVSDAIALVIIITRLNICIIINKEPKNMWVVLSNIGTDASQKENYGYHEVTH